MPRAAWPVGLWAAGRVAQQFKVSVYARGVREERCSVFRGAVKSPDFLQTFSGVSPLIQRRFYLTGFGDSSVFAFNLAASRFLRRSHRFRAQEKSASPSQARRAFSDIQELSSPRSITSSVIVSEMCPFSPPLCNRVNGRSRYPAWPREPSFPKSRPKHDLCDVDRSLRVCPRPGNTSA